MALYIIARCIIYKETRKNSGGRLCAVAPPSLPRRLREMPWCISAHTHSESARARRACVWRMRWIVMLRGGGGGERREASFTSH